jgi:hypothetical protein
MSPFSRAALILASLPLASLAFADRAMAGDAHADGSSATRDGACKLATALARQGIPASRVASSHCECLENKDDKTAPWSCTAFVGYK